MRGGLLMSMVDYIKNSLVFGSLTPEDPLDTYVISGGNLAHSEGVLSIDSISGCTYKLKDVFLSSPSYDDYVVPANTTNLKIYLINDGGVGAVEQGLMQPAESILLAIVTTDATGITKFIEAKLTTVRSVSWGEIQGLVTNQTDLAQQYLSRINVTYLTNTVNNQTKILDTTPTSALSVRYDYVVSDGSVSRSGSIMLLFEPHNNSVRCMESANNTMGDTSDLIFTASVSAGNIRLSATATKNYNTVKLNKYSFN
jgi:hypothetical protein